jgi:hypothetical protein
MRRNGEMRVAFLPFGLFAVGFSPPPRAVTCKSIHDAGSYTIHYLRTAGG